VTCLRRAVGDKRAGWRLDCSNVVFQYQTPCTPVLIATRETSNPIPQKMARDHISLETGEAGFLTIAADRMNVGMACSLCWLDVRSPRSRSGNRVADANPLPRISRDALAGIAARDIGEFTFESGGE
jgi:hypothetical protein